ncbi:hypothetical protein LPW26_06025 [Rhodopseudomonas sp. HC1]|uniref:hypothetical protein n=1 Tax=Rhodopseudomonas infernalis TaxID=2897386 RepID=UPI001EE7A820|nr:hypothetical protein [Rhodopseudomonas infernalis]MCG6204184.1 hypothetical protein [Rhodopseudomonas infernalis]
MKIGARSIARGDTKDASEQLKFVAQSSIEDLRSTAQSVSIALARLRLTSRR